MNDPVLKAREAAPYLCRRGTLMFCQANGLDYLTLVREGYPRSVLLASGDAKCAEVVAKIMADREAAQHGR